MKRQFGYATSCSSNSTATSSTIMKIQGIKLKLSEILEEDVKLSEKRYYVHG